MLATERGDAFDADRQALSALADGAATRDEVERAVAAWARDPSLQRAWQDWHRIGDALRSDDLARPASPGEDFLVGLRRRLAHVPQQAEAGSADRGAVAEGASWKAPAVAPPAWRTALALAAGVAVVAVGVSLLHPVHEGGSVVAGNASKATTPSRSPSPPWAGQTPVPSAVVTTRPGPDAGVLAVSPGPGGAPQVLIRDPYLDSILRAQRPAPSAGEPAAASGRIETVGLDR